MLPRVSELVMSLRKNLWDEENRLRGVDLNPDDEDDHPIAVYTYDAGGARIVRYNLDRIDVSSNAKEVGQAKKDNVMIYPSGLLMGKATEFSPIENRLTYTKHYYIGSERISAKTGTVEDMGLFPASLVSGQIPALTDHEFVRAPSDQSRLDAKAVVRDVHLAFGQSEPQFSGFREDFKIRYDHTLQLNTFYFHKDHLGSSSYITNDVGNVTQHMEYLPFGETLVDEHTNSFNSPFKFNGKELDEETGNYYYGARYYDPKFSIFISVDPLAEKYPDWSSYAYTFNNPIRYIDPDGRAPEDIIVPKKYQAQFNSALKSVFGSEASNFSYDSNGKLSFSGDPKNFNSDQKAVFKGLDKLMTSKDLTNVIYEKTYTIVDNNGKSILIDASKSGGESTILKAENSNLSENYVIIDPNASSSIQVQEVTGNYYSSKGTMPSPGDPPNYKPATVQTSPESSTFHGLGHVIYAGKPQHKVLKYDNRARNQMGLPKRNPDETHNSTVTKGSGSVWENN